MSTATRLKMYLEYKGVSVNRAEIDCGISSSGLSTQLRSKDYPDGKSIGSENLEKLWQRIVKTVKSERTTTG